jgi:hypothetical protein
MIRLTGSFQHTKNNDLDLARHLNGMHFRHLCNTIIPLILFTSCSRFSQSKIMLNLTLTIDLKQFYYYKLKNNIHNINFILYENIFYNDYDTIDFTL